MPVIAHFKLTADINREAVERGRTILPPGSTIPRSSLERFMAALDVQRLPRRLLRKKAGFSSISTGSWLPLIQGDQHEFFDLIHPREPVREAVGRAIADQLGPRVVPLLDRAEPRAATEPTPKTEPAADRPSGLPETGQIDPLW